MLPDDPRHGTYAGYIAHRKEGSEKCDPCRVAERRYRKRYELNEGTMTTLGDDAYKVIVTTPPMALSRATGLASTSLSRLRRGGPTTRIRKDTKAKILKAARPVTVIGAQRRLQALAALGWSNAHVSELTGLHHDNLNVLRRGDRKHYCREGVAERIVAAYEELSMRLPEPGRRTTWVRTNARNHGWLPPLAWDDEAIDDPAAKPYRPRKNGTHKPLAEVDEAVVIRVLSGETLPCTKAEKDEVMRRWVASGRPARVLAQRMGWHDDRYGKGAA